MLRSLFSAVSGMLTHQGKMDVIGNNISNSNTLAYKESRAQFSSAFTQTTRSATVNQPVGIDVGLGSQLDNVSTSFGQGVFQRTDIPSDLGVSGEGWFAVEDIGGNQFVTRKGDFILDSLGFLRSPSGNYLLGVAGTTAPTTPSAGFPTDRLQIPNVIGATTERVVNYTIDTDGTVQTTGENGSTEIIGFVTVQRYTNNNGLINEGNSLFRYQAAAGTNEFYQPGLSGAGTVQSGVLEASNVDLARQFSEMIVTQRGFDANARVITTSDDMLQTVTNLKR